MYKRPGKVLAAYFSAAAFLAVAFPSLDNVLAAPANSAYTSGVNLYKQKNYRAAAQQFELAMKASPGSPDVIYYCALCAQLSNNRTRAKQLFEYLTQRFPGSRVAPLAQQALSQLSSLGAASSSSASSAVSSSAGSSSSSAQYAQPSVDLSGVPEMVRVPFEKRGNDIIVQTQVNGKTVPMVLDTGAGAVTVGQNHLKAWGLATNQAKDTFDIGGVGDGKAKGWTQKLELRLGPIVQRNFTVMVMDNMPTDPLLGQTFLRYFNVRVDDGSRTVILAKKGGLAARDVAHKSYSGIEVPFKRLDSGHMMVKVKVNNKDFEMMFDTGCERTCFSLADWKKLGFEIPASAVNATSRGVLGDTETFYFNCDSIKLLGKSRYIEQQATPISVAKGSPESLLGMSFYGKFKYTIDSAHNVIIFEGVDR